jgi:hypothetical protein
MQNPGSDAGVFVFGALIFLACQQYHHASFRGGAKRWSR